MPRFQVAAQFAAGDDHAMHLVRAIRQAQGALCHVHARQGRVLGNAQGTVHLDRLVDDADRDIGHRSLDHRDPDPRLLRVRVIHHPGGLEGEQARLVDRLAAEREYDEDKRRRLIVALAMSLAKTVKDNRVDFDGEGDHSKAFVELLNERMSEYAGFAYSDGEPGFQLRRRVGEHVQAVMGEKDNKWVPDQVMEIEIPDALKVFKRVVRGLI